MKKFLGLLLHDHIRSEFPNVVKEIEESLSDTKKEQDLLGPSRQTVTDQRRFLNRMANLYQKEVDDALGGNYSTDSPLKLRMHVRALDEEFSHEMTTKGRPLENLSDAERQDRPRVYETFTFISTGNASRAILENLFHQQPSPWKSIALAYIAKVKDAVATYNEKAIIAIIRDEDVKAKLAARLAHIQEEAFNKATSDFSRVLEDERGGILQTVNDYYADTLNTIQEQRVLERLQEIDFENKDPETNLEEVMKTVHLSNEDQSVNDIHDILKAYYKVAVKRFAHNFVIQIVERYILARVDLFVPSVQTRSMTLKRESFWRLPARAF